MPERQPIVIPPDFDDPQAPAGTARVSAVIPVGVPGPKGDTGDTGPKGDTGDTGEQGPKGDQGDPGADGTDGADGAPGAAGASAYDVAVADGFVGTEVEWLASLVGPPGANGTDGTDGAPGADGQDGADGAPGVVQSLVEGANILIDATDPANPIISSTTSGSGTVESVLPGDETITIDDADPANPTVKVTPGTFDADGDAALAETNAASYTDTAIASEVTRADAAYATAGQGAEADSAVQPGDLATVATTGAYADLSGKPTLGTAAAAATTDFDAAGAAAAAQAGAIAASQPVDSDLTAIAALTTTTFGRSLLTQADAAALRTTAGLGTAAVAATGDFDAAGAAASAQAASQPLDSDLTAIAALTTTPFGRSFLALADAAAGRTLLGLGTAATSASGDFDAAGTAAALVVDSIADADTTHAPSRNAVFDALALKVPTSRSVASGTGLTGGGDLSADRTLSLPNVGTAGTYGDTSHIPVVTTDAQGRVSGVSSTAIAIDATAVAHTINAQTGTSYTLVLGDAGKFVSMSNASASTLTVPPNSSVAFPVGTIIEGAQIGAGQVTLTAGAGVTINATPGLKVAAQYGSFALIKTATDTWLAMGRLSA